MKIENDFYKKNKTEWEIVNINDPEEKGYKYKTIKKTKLINRPYTYKALKMLIDAKIKTNIHFVYSKLTHKRAIDILKGKDVWNGKVELEKLNAIIFLLFKPQGNGKLLTNWIPSYSMIKEFSELIIKPSCKVKVGMDSCLVNHVLQYVEMDDMQKMSVDSCESSRMSVYISPSMHLIPCSFADHEKCGVSLKKKSIFKVWNTAPEFKRFRKILKKNPYTCPAGF